MDFAKEKIGAKYSYIFGGQRPELAVNVTQNE